MSTMTREILRPPGIPGSAVELLDRSREGLRHAEEAGDRAERYVHAHLAALRAAAAVLAVRGRPRRAGSPLNVWVVLSRVAPEFEQWAAYFAAGAPQRQAVEAGRTGAVTTREADDLLRAAADFLTVVSTELGVIPLR